VDSAQRAFVCGGLSDNVFKITRDGAITEIIDSSGAGPGSHLDAPREITVDRFGNVYVAALVSHNAFVFGSPWPRLPGASYCFGDSNSGAPCPCDNDNDGSVPGSGCDNGVFASGAQLTGFGCPSVSLDSVILTVTHAEPFSAGPFFQAKNDLSPGIAWGDGLRCAGGGEIRLQVRFADASGTAGTTIPIAAAGGAGGGDTRRYQFWYRTIGAPPCGLGVNDFNTTNGYAITWSL